MVKKRYVHQASAETQPFPHEHREGMLGTDPLLWSLCGKAIVEGNGEKAVVVGRAEKVVVTGRAEKAEEE